MTRDEHPPPSADLVAALDAAGEGWAIAVAVREQECIVDFRLVHLNQAGAHAVGRRPEDLVGRLCGALWPGLVPNGLMAAFVSAVETRTPVTRVLDCDEGRITGRFELRIRPVGDGFAVCFTDAAPTTKSDVAGLGPLTNVDAITNVGPVADVGAGADVEAGTDAGAHLRAVLDAAFDGFALLHAVRPAGAVVDFTITYVNEVGAKLGGRDLRDLIGHRLLEVIPAVVDSGLMDRLREVVDSGHAYGHEYGEPDVGGAFEVKATRVADGVIALSYRDISDRVRQERRISASETSAHLAAARTVALQSATAALARAVTVADVYQVMTEQVQPLAGWESLVVMLREEDQLVVRHATNLTASASRNLRPAPLDDKYPMAAVVRTRTAMFFRTLDEYIAAFPEREQQARAAQRGAWAFIPLLSADRAIGAVALGYREARPFDEPERESLVALGELYAQAIERAMLFEAQRSIAADLQHALLPAELPSVAGARHAVRYRPWTSGADVGGDWYDIIQVGEDSLGVAIGDVAGHNVSAAATMGQIRNALRAYALEGHSPTSVMERVNRLLTNVEPEAMATCCYLELHLAEGTATVVLAGHLPPVLCHGGGAGQLRLRLGPPLGVSPATAYVDTSVLVPHGSALLLFTDGLVEDRRFPIERGMAELCAALSGGPVDDPAELVDRVLAAGIGPSPRRDDVALLAISVDEGHDGDRPEPSASRRFHSDATSVPSARRFAGDMLTAWSVEDLADTTRLLLGEIITNAVQHTVGDVRVRLLLRPRLLRVEVRDGSDRQPSVRMPDPDSESGRGLQIVASLADAWGHDAHDSGGKVVWFELAR